MSQSLAVIHIHAVFATKDRLPLLAGKELRESLHAYIGGVSATLDCPPVLVGGVADHVHVLARLGRVVSVADWIKEMKRVSALWIKETDAAGLSGFRWQTGYGAFAVSASHVVAVRDYIANQEEHHRRVSFREEYETLLRKNGAEYDRRYLWE